MGWRASGTDGQPLRPDRAANARPDVGEFDLTGAGTQATSRFGFAILRIDPVRWENREPAPRSRSRLMVPHEEGIADEMAILQARRLLAWL